METALKCLLVEDSEQDAMLLLETLRQGGYHPVFERVQTEKDMRLSLLEKQWEVIFCDYVMPQFSAPAAFQVFLECDPKIPFIIVSGEIGEDHAVESLKFGADDYVLKRNLNRLVPVLKRSLKDVEHRRERDAARHMNELIMANSVDMICTIDEQFRFVEVSAASSRLLGYEPNELEGRKFTDCLHPEDLERTELEVSFVMEGRAIYHFENRYARKDGVTTYLSWSASWSPTDRLLFCVARDITEQKQAEIQRQQMELQLRHAQKLEAIGQLAAGIAHEINTPTQFTEHNLRFLQETFPKLVQLVKGAEKPSLVKADAASGEKPDEPQGTAGSEFEFLIGEIPAAIEEALQGTGRISKIVQAMKEFSHPGTNNSKPEPTNINHAIETTITVARSEWKHVAEMVTAFDPELPFVPVFAGEFNQVILNLVVNAAHAISEATNGDKQRKGIITVSTRHDDDRVEVRVTDNGTGIPEHVRDRIFEPFFTTKRVGLGTGQGLTLAHSVIVKKHLGDLRFETETGKGTSFIIRLPLGQPVQNGEGRPEGKRAKT
jgi:two-component system NtrC family sensor kinase